MRRGWHLCLAFLLHQALVAQKIPELHGTTFSGQAVSLPEAFRGKVGILVIGFSQGSREAVTVWGTKLAADYLDSPSVAYYEIPVLASVPKLIRGFTRQSWWSRPFRAGSPFRGLQRPPGSSVGAQGTIL